MTVAIPRTQTKRKPALSKKDALLGIVSLIDQRAPTDDQGRPTRWLTPQEYNSLLDDIYTLAADALGIPL